MEMPDMTSPTVTVKVHSEWKILADVSPLGARDDEMARRRGDRKEDGSCWNDISSNEARCMCRENEDAVECI